MNLRLIRLFPVAVLDRGQLPFYLAEALPGGPLAARSREYGYHAGLAFLAGLSVFATWNNLMNLGLVRWVASLIG